MFYKSLVCWIRVCNPIDNVARLFFLILQCSWNWCKFWLRFHSFKTVPDQGLIIQLRSLILAVLSEEILFIFFIWFQEPFYMFYFIPLHEPHQLLSPKREKKKWEDISQVLFLYFLYSNVSQSETKSEF